MMHTVSALARRWGMPLAITCSVMTSAAWAARPKDPQTVLDQKAFFRPELYISSSNVALKDALPDLQNRSAWESFFVGRGEDAASPRTPVYIDPRGGAVSNLISAVPMIPGDGVGNHVTLASLGATKLDEAVVERAVRKFVNTNAAVLGIDVAQLGKARVSKIDDALWQITIPQQYKGVPVRYGRLAASISHGNMVVIGTENWGNVKIDNVPALSADEALAAGFDFAGAREGRDLILKDPRLEIVPYAPPEHQQGEAFAGPVGSGYAHRLVYSFTFQRTPELARWEVLVDAQSGKVIAFEDKNDYADRSITGGVYPITNTGICPTPEHCGTMQSGWPMPFADTGFPAPNNFTNSNGHYEYTSGTVKTTLTGQYIDVTDSCGNTSETSGNGDLNLGGVNNQHDCTSAGASAGDTASSRSAFYELNRIAGQARGYLPHNFWLQARLGAVVNLSQTCNAFWDGSRVNFFKSGGGCRNTGEEAGVFDHEWGHGLDDNDANGFLSNSSEAYADIAAILRLQTACVGYGFFWTLNQGCGMTADGTGFNADNAQVGASDCDLDCSGVRGQDWNMHANHTPDTALGFVCNSCLGGSGPCGREVHCAGAPSAQSAWDLAARDLQDDPFNYDSDTAFILANKTFYRGSGNIGAWHSCTCGGNADGCGATNAYMQWVTADDDDGNLSNGTPHMTAINAAFKRHGIACNSPTPQNSGCAGGPTQAPVVVAADGGNLSIDLSWNAVPNATRYAIFRTEGVAGCDFGKTRIANTTGTSYTDQDLQAGRTYYYNVVAAGSTAACLTPASECVNATPTP